MTAASDGHLAKVARWWSSPARARDAYAVAALIGLAVNLLVFGWGHLTGSSDYWDLPEIDARPHLMGYRYFLDEPWHWPVFEVHKINVPTTKNIFFTDSIPFWALVNKAIATVIPPWGRFTNRSYLGLWSAVVDILQPVVAVAIMRHLGRRTISQAVATSLVFLAIPTLIFRYGHASLSAHFLLLTAILLYLRSSPDRAPRAALYLRLQFIGLLVVSALINPYHLVMGAALYAASLTRSRRWAVIALWLPVGALIPAATIWLAGFLSRETSGHMSGFDIASTNLLSPLIPVRSLLFGDGHGIANVLAVPYQFEGYAYLGLGFILLIALFVAHVVRSPSGLVASMRRHPALILVVLGAAIYSLSNKVYFGSHLVLEYPVPGPLHWLVGQYRVPGRFVWLPMYVVLLYVFAWALEHFTSESTSGERTPLWRRVILPGIVIVQLIDGGGGDWKFWRDQTRTHWNDELGIKPWTALVRSHTLIEQTPSYDCILSGDVPGLDYVAQEVQYFSSGTAIAINGVYTARPTRDCLVEFKAMASPELLDGSLLVLWPAAAEGAKKLEARGVACGDFAWGKACSSNRAAIVAAKAAGVLEDPPPFEPGVRVSFTGRRVTAKEYVPWWAAGPARRKPFLRHGWIPDTDGVWSFGPTSGLAFRAPPAPATLTLAVSSNKCPVALEQKVDLFMDGVLVDTLLLPASRDQSPVQWSIKLPPESAGSPSAIMLRPKDRRSTRALGCGGEDLPLGIKLHALVLESP